MSRLTQLRRQYSIYQLFLKIRKLTPLPQYVFCGIRKHDDDDNNDDDDDDNDDDDDDDDDDKNT